MAAADSGAVAVALGEALRAERDRPDMRGPRCATCTLISTLPEKEADALLAALADETFTGAAIARAIRQEGYQSVTPTSVQRHRRGECRREP